MSYPHLDDQRRLWKMDRRLVQLGKIVISSRPQEYCPNFLTLEFPDALRPGHAPYWPPRYLQHLVSLPQPPPPGAEGAGRRAAAGAALHEEGANQRVLRYNRNIFFLYLGHVR